MKFTDPIPNPRGPWKNSTGARFAILGGNTIRTTKPVTEAADEAAFAASKGLTLVAPLTPIEQAREAAKAAFAALPLGKQSLWEPVRADVDADLVKGDLAAAVARIKSVPVIYDGMDADRAAFLALFGVSSAPAS